MLLAGSSVHEADARTNGQRPARRDRSGSRPELSRRRDLRPLGGAGQFCLVGDGGLANPININFEHWPGDLGTPSIEKLRETPGRWVLFLGTSIVRSYCPVSVNSSVFCRVNMLGHLFNEVCDATLIIPFAFNFN